MADALPYGKAVMREKERQRTCSVIALVAAFAVSPVVAESTRSTGCPANFDCGRRIERLLEIGMAESDALGSLVEALAAHPRVELKLRFRRQKPGTRAQSSLVVRGIYVRLGSETRRQVTAVSGEVGIPYVAYGRRQIELLAHELEHVRVLLESHIPHGTPEEEQAAIRFENLVHAELDGSI